MYSEKAGYVERLDARSIGEASVKLAVGFYINKKIGDRVKAGDVLAYVHANNEEKGKNAVEEVKNAYKIADYQTFPEEYILDII